VIGITSGSTTTLSAIDAVGNRVATGSGGAVGFLLPDLHGNTAAALNSTCTAVTDAFAYDAYGNTVAAVTSALPTPWRYQGRILESAAGTPDLYDFGARSYNPTIGTFTSLDSTHGSAQNPALLNGYLYANANPATLVDPDGHCAIAPSNRDEAMWCAAHADTTYGQAGPTGRTPADNVVNASRKTLSEVAGARQSGGSTPTNGSNTTGGSPVVSSQASDLVQQPCAQAAPNPQGAVGACPKTMITKDQAKIYGDESYREAFGNLALAVIVVGGAAALCLAAVTCAVIGGVAVYTLANSGSNVLSGKAPQQGWNWFDALAGGTSNLLMSKTPEGSGAAMGLGFLLGTGGEVLSEELQHPGAPVNWNHALCTGATSAYSAGLIFGGDSEGSASSDVKATIWDTVKSTVGTKYCEGQ
jgi:RHS repeat-associated protein